MFLITSTSVPSPPVFVISHSTISSHSQGFSSFKKISMESTYFASVCTKWRATYWNLGSSSLKKTRLSLSMRLFITNISSARGGAL